VPPWKRAVRAGAVALMAGGLLLLLAPLARSAPTVADIAVVVIDHPDPVVTKHNLTYTISVSNVGITAAVAVKVHDVLSSTQTYVSSHTPQGTCAFTSGSFDCDLGDVGPGLTRTLTLVVKEMGSLQDSTTVSVTTSSSDPVPANNQSRALTMVKRAPSPSHSPKPHKSPKPTPSGSVTSSITISPGSGGGSTTLPIMGAIFAALAFLALAGVFAWRERRAP
jgi:uncharacterized repeat protein (TIGR01451 family)/MYXO-CTERM domain-containing protein